MERDEIPIKNGMGSLDFNSHAHVERDPSAADLRRAQAYFNSHAHVERDQLNSYLLCAKLNFNSHAHVERDIYRQLFRV